MILEFNPWRRNQFILAISIAVVTGGLFGWGIADASRGYRSEDDQRMKEALRVCHADHKNMVGAIAQASLECKAKVKQCRDKSVTNDEKLAVCYGLLKAGPPECMASMLAYDLKLPKKKPAPKPKGKP